MGTKFFYIAAAGVAAFLFYIVFLKDDETPTPLKPATGAGNGASGGSNYNAATDPNTGGNTNPSTPSFNPPRLNYDKLLKRGVSGREVLVLQRILKQYEGSQLQTDGAMGAITEQALNRVTGKTQIKLNEVPTALRIIITAANSYP